MNDVYTDGVLRQRWDDAARTYSEWDAAGVLIVTRPFTAAENAEADNRAASEAALAAYIADRAMVKAIITDLQAEKTRAQAVIDNANSTPREKDLGRAAKRIADAAIDLARFVKDR